MPQSAIRTLLKKFGNSKGENNCKIYFSRLCTCVAGNNGVYDPQCKECIYGFIYAEPIEELVIRTAMRIDRQNEKMSNLYEGGARITIPKYGIDRHEVIAYSKITQGDIITMTGDNRRDRDICELGTKDYLIAFDVKKVLSVSEKRKEFVLHTDYEVNYSPMQTEIKWLEGERPSKFYSVEFISEINYLVWSDQAKPRGGSDDTVPKMVFCRLRPGYDPASNISMESDVSYRPLNKIIEGT